MTFKVVSVGWQCGEWLQRTLQSVEAQTITDWDVRIVYDPSDDDGAERVRSWCDERDDRWSYQLNTERQFAVRNQHEAIQALDPADDDIVVFLDLDGDMLADPHVFERLQGYYNDGTLVTYGNYRPVPSGAQMPIRPYPADVVRNRSYRDYTYYGGCSFNHLRTMKGVVAKAIPVEECQWRAGPRAGEWYGRGTDYIFMLSAMELADGRYKCLDDVLLLYNHANPLADYLVSIDQGEVREFLSRGPLPALPAQPAPALSFRPDAFEPMEFEGRRDVLRDLGRRHGLNVLVETGTNRGGTPRALCNDFAQIHTIELDRGLHQEARIMFRHHPHIECLQGDSGEVLTKVLDRLSGPALIWLDGHYSGPGTAHGIDSTPIRRELAALFADGRPHVILIDDARIFGGGPEHGDEDHYRSYPDLHWIRDVAVAHGYGFEVDKDIIRLTPAAELAERALGSVEERVS